MTFKKHTDKPVGTPEKVICSCCTGKVIPFDSISEDLFPSAFIGDGFCISASGNYFVCPASGEIKDVSENGLDVTIKTKDRLILIVSLARKGGKPIDAEVCIQRGDIVSVGTELWKTDISDGTLVTAVILTNSSGKELDVKYGIVKQAGIPVLSIK